jgi:hypothetical protein
MMSGSVEREWKGEEVNGRAVFVSSSFVGLSLDSGEQFRFPSEWLDQAGQQADKLGLEEGETATAVLVDNVDGPRTLRVTRHVT